MNPVEELATVIERYCACGYRGETPETHPHVIGCPTELALMKARRWLEQAGDLRHCRGCKGWVARPPVTSGQTVGPMSDPCPGIPAGGEDVAAMLRCFADELDIIGIEPRASAAARQLADEWLRTHPKESRT